MTRGEGRGANRRDQKSLGGFTFILTTDRRETFLKFARVHKLGVAFLVAVSPALASTHIVPPTQRKKTKREDKSMLYLISI